jgi:hypothetical protein
MKGLSDSTELLISVCRCRVSSCDPTSALTGANEASVRRAQKRSCVRVEQTGRPHWAPLLGWWFSLTSQASVRNQEPVCGTEIAPVQKSAYATPL